MLQALNKTEMYNHRGQSIFGIWNRHLLRNLMSTMSSSTSRERLSSFMSGRSSAFSGLNSRWSRRMQTFFSANAHPSSSIETRIFFTPAELDSVSWELNPSSIAASNTEPISDQEWQRECAQASTGECPPQALEGKYTQGKGKSYIQCKLDLNEIQDNVIKLCCRFGDGRGWELSLETELEQCNGPESNSVEGSERITFAIRVYRTDDVAQPEVYRQSHSRPAVKKHLLLFLIDRNNITLAQASVLTQSQLLEMAKADCIFEEWRRRWLLVAAESFERISNR